MQNQLRWSLNFFTKSNPVHYYALTMELWEKLWSGSVYIKLSTKELKNIIILNVTIFVFRLRHLVTSNFVVWLLHILWVKQQYFFSSSSISKENIDKSLKVPHESHSQIFRILIPFSRKQRKNKTCMVSKYVYYPNTFVCLFLRKIEQIGEILLTS